MKKIVSFISVVTLCAMLLCSFWSAEAVPFETKPSGNVIPDAISTFETATVGQTPDGIKGWDNSGVEKPFTDNNYTVVPTVVEDDDAHGKVLKMQPNNATITPRWAIGSQLYAEANKTPDALKYKITISADVKKECNDREKINFKMAADKTDPNFGTQYTNVLCGQLGNANVGVNEWTTLTVTCELTLEQLQNNNNGDYYNIYFTSTGTLTGPMYIDNVTATVTPIYDFDDVTSFGEDLINGVFNPDFTAEDSVRKIVKYFDVSPNETALRKVVSGGARPSILLTVSDPTVTGKRIGIKSEVVSAVTGNKTGVYMLSAEVNSVGGTANTLYAQIGCSNSGTIELDRANGFVGSASYLKYINSNVVSRVKSDAWTTVKFVFALSEDWLKDNTGIWFCQDGTKKSMYLYNITLKKLDVDFSTVSVDLGTSLSLNASVKEDFTGTVKPILGDATKLAVRFTRGGKSVEVEPNADGKFVFDNIAPQCMTENITAELLYTDRQGTKVVAQRENYSIKEYFNALYAENSGNTKLVSLLSDALTYGAAAQNYTGFNLDNLATADVNWLAPTTRTIPVDNMGAFGNSEANKATAAGVYFANSNRIYFKFVKEAGAEIKLYKNGEEVEYSLQEGNKAYSPDILPTEYDAVFKFVITKDSQAVYTVEYRVNDYIARKQNSANIGALVKAMNNYGGSCKEYKQ